MSTDQLPTRFAFEFFVLRVAQDMKAKDFFTNELHTRAGSTRSQGSHGVRQGGLLPQGGDVEKEKKGKEKDQGRRECGSPVGKAPCALNQEFLFWFMSIWVLRDPSRLKYRLLHHFYTRKPCAKEVPEMDYFTQRKQYLKRTTLRRLKSRCECSEECRTIALERSVREKAVI